LARRATYIKQHQSSREHSLILDSGDIIAGKGNKEKLKGDFLFQALAKLNYNAINPGERDFLQGLKFLTDITNKYNLALTSANVFHPDGKKHVLSPYIFKEFEGFQHGDSYIPSIRIGIFGVMMYRSQLTYDENEPKLIVDDPIETAKNVVSQIKGKCDLIVGLVHLPYNQLTNFVKQVPGIDVIIAGHDPVFRMQPQKIDNTIIIVGGNRGQYIGDLRLVLNDQGKIIDYEGKVVPLDKKIKDDPEMAKLIDEYKKKDVALTHEINRERYREIKMYLGAKACKECHDDQYKHWKKTLHASAFDALKTENKHYDLHCAQCHTTGFAQYNGFYNFKETPEMVNVQCESCHGIGKLHVQSVERMKSKKLRAAILAPISEETCISCHTKSRDPKFVYKKDFNKVKH